MTYRYRYKLVSMMKKPVQSTSDMRAMYKQSSESRLRQDKSG
ncbi:hypothetical protein AVEN_172156-1, partial [Araneus ventricosus]